MKRILLTVALLLCAATVNAQENTKALLYYTASWCHYCKQTTPIVHKLKREGYPIQIVDIDIPENNRGYKRTGMTSVPAFLIASTPGGNLIPGPPPMRQGAMNEQQLRDWLHRNGVTPRNTQP